MVQLHVGPCSIGFPTAHVRLPGKFKFATRPPCHAHAWPRMAMDKPRKKSRNKTLDALRDEEIHVINVVFFVSA